MVRQRLLKRLDTAWQHFADRTRSLRGATDGPGATGHGRHRHRSHVTTWEEEA